MLEIVFRRRPDRRRLRVAGKLHVLVGDVRRRSADLHVRAVRFVNAGQRILTLASCARACACSDRFSWLVSSPLPFAAARHPASCFPTPTHADQDQHARHPRPACRSAKQSCRRSRSPALIHVIDGRSNPRPQLPPRCCSIFSPRRVGPLTRRALNGEAFLRDGEPTVRNHSSSLRLYRGPRGATLRASSAAKITLASGILDQNLMVLRPYSKSFFASPE